MRKLFLGLLFITAFITILPFGGYSQTAVEEELRLYLGQAKSLPVNSPKRVAVGNPAIADVGNISKEALTINPQAVGNTTLVIWDNFGEQAYRLKVFAEDTKEIKNRVDNMLAKLNLPNVYTTAEDEESRVVILGTVKDDKDKERMKVALAQLKDKIIDLTTLKGEEAVVEVDVQIIEVYRGAIETLGFQWPEQFSLTEIAGANTAGGAGVNSWAKLFKMNKLTRGSNLSGSAAGPFNVTLDTLITQHKARVLSRPRVSCLSGKEAKLLVGGQVPIISGTTGGGNVTTTATGGTVEYKDYGIVLKVTPQVTPEGRLHVNLGVEVSELGDVVETLNALAYTFTKRSAETELLLDDGETVGIGGLIKQRSEEDLQKFPWLGDIPVLGVFFRHKAYSRGKQGESTNQDVELFISLTPHIVNQPSNAPPKEIKSLPANIPTVNDDNIKDPVLKYSKIVQKRILDNLSYPDSAKEAGFQGTVKLSLKLSAQGDLLDLKIKESSNYRLLDDNAARTAQKIAPYPPFPPVIKETQLWVDIPITYQLE